MKLEAKYGPLIGFSPAVDDVLDYLQSVRTYLPAVDDVLDYLQSVRAYLHCDTKR